MDKEPREGEGLDREPRAKKVENPWPIAIQTAVDSSADISYHSVCRLHGSDNLLHLNVGRSSTSVRFAGCCSCRPTIGEQGATTPGKFGSTVLNLLSMSVDPRAHLEIGSVLNLRFFRFFLYC